MLKGTRTLLDSIDITFIAGLRDGRCSRCCVTPLPVLALPFTYALSITQNGNRWWLRLHEKSAKRHGAPPSQS